MSDLSRKFIETALRQVGAPYIWGGKGTHLFSVEKGLVVNPFIGNDYSQPPLLVFDCSGLVTWSLHQLSTEDMRARWSAQVMFDTLPKPQALGPHLRYYGNGEKRITHVAVAIQTVDGKWLVVEAAGGDATTNTVLESRRRGANVRCRFESRDDFVGSTQLPVE